MFQILYGSTAAGLYDQAAKLNAQARTLYLQSSDTYYKANDGAPLPPSRYFRRRFRLPVASAICMRGRCAIFPVASRAPRLLRPGLPRLLSRRDQKPGAEGL